MQVSACSTTDAVEVLVLAFEQDDQRWFSEPEIGALARQLIDLETRVQLGHALQRAMLSLSNQLVAQAQGAAVTEAETCLRQSVAVARRQGARSLELRAVTSLSRPWQAQGKKQQARQALAQVYDWFTEGHDTMDLRAAKTLLEELAR